METRDNNDSCSKSVILMGYKVETMNIDGTIYFPCKICKRLFKDEKLAIEHLQKCKPRIYLNVTDDTSMNDKKFKDPYEIIPEEMDREDELVNNNSKKCTSNEILNSSSKYRRYYKNNNEDEFIDKKNSLFHKKIMKNSAEPKKRKSNKRLSDEEIQERLKKISETLKKHAQNKNEKEQTVIDDIIGGNEEHDGDVDDDEDDEFRAIEDKLIMLNRDSLHAEYKNDNLNNEQLNVCKICGKVFMNAMDLLKHSRVHTYPKITMAPSEIEKLLKIKDKSYCPICRKPLNSSYKSVYSKHLQTHCFGIEHQCSICKKKFKRKDHMKAHEKRHIVVC